MCGAGGEERGSGYGEEKIKLQLKMSLIVLCSCLSGLLEFDSFSFLSSLPSASAPRMHQIMCQIRK